MTYVYLGDPYSKTVDVWALGIIVFVLLCGYLPFDIKEHEEFYHENYKNDKNYKQNDHSIKNIKMRKERSGEKFQLRFPQRSSLTFEAKGRYMYISIYL